MKKIITLLLAALLGLSCLAAGCNKKKVDSGSPETLEVYIYNAGYGYEWVVKLLDAFAQEDWVREKYPNLQTDYEKNEVENYASSMLESSASTNRFEIIFGQNLNKYLGKNGKVEDLTEKVYKAKVPGEDVTVEEKMYDSVRSSNVDPSVDEAQDAVYYTMTYASGMTGIAYNEDVLVDRLGMKVPNTTDELIAVMKAVHDKNSTSSKYEGYENTYSLVTYGSSAYTNYMLNTWWAQYEGSDGFANYFSGYDVNTNSISAEVVEQKGRLKALSVLENIMSKNNGYTYLSPSSGREAYRQVQNMLVMGQGVFMANGDWFDNEMRSFCEGLEQTQGYCDTVKLMKTPVISSIIDQTPTIENDAELSALISAIDAGETALKGEGYDVSQEDFDRILEARVVVYSIGPGHNAVVPKTAVGKEVAYDFLRYMATDKANRIYIETTRGASLPFDYDCKEEDPELFESLSPMQKDRLEYFNNYQAEIDLLPAPQSFPLVLYGGFAAFKSCANAPGYRFLNGESAGSYATAAEKLYYEDINYWQEDGARRFLNAVNQAGL